MKEDIPLLRLRLCFFIYFFADFRLTVSIVKGPAPSEKQQKDETFWNCGPTTVWLNLRECQIFLSKITPP